MWGKRQMPFGNGEAFLSQQSNLSAIEELRDPLMKSVWKPEHEHKGEDLSVIRYGEGSRGSGSAGDGGALCSVKLPPEAREVVFMLGG